MARPPLRAGYFAARRTEPTDRASSPHASQGAHGWQLAERAMNYTDIELMDKYESTVQVGSKAEAALLLGLKPRSYQRHRKGSQPMTATTRLLMRMAIEHPRTFERVACQPAAAESE